MAFIYLEQVKEDWQTIPIKDFININHIVFFRADTTFNDITIVFIEGLGYVSYNIDTVTLYKSINEM